MVADSGDGIPDNFLQYVFEPFRQADGSTTRPHAGLGLGLSIVKQLVEAHGGTLELLSEPRQGTTAIIELP
jgi:signal transduction histidine kinase